MLAGVLGVFLRPVLLVLIYIIDSITKAGETIRKKKHNHMGEFRLHVQYDDGEVKFSRINVYIIHKVSYNLFI